MKPIRRHEDFGYFNEKYSKVRFLKPEPIKTKCNLLLSAYFINFFQMLQLIFVIIICHNIRFLTSCYLKFCIKAQMPRIISWNTVARCVAKWRPEKFISKRSR